MPMIYHPLGIMTFVSDPPPPKVYDCDCGFHGLRHTPSCNLYHLTEEGGFTGSYPPGGGDDDSDLD